jgi:hypothetical protein
MARFCLATGFKPKDYWDLNLEEYVAILNALEERRN